MKSYKNSDKIPPIMIGSSTPQEWRVPLIDWDRPPWNRWTFQNIRQILPTANIKHDKNHVSELKYNLQNIEDINFKDTNNQSVSVSQMLNDTYTDGFLVHIGGHIIHESYYNEMRPDTVHIAQSVSKSVTATVAGILIGRGLLDPNENITNYLSELKETAWNGAKLQHVFDMTSGVKFGEEYDVRNSDIGKMDVASGWKPIPEGSDPNEHWPECVWDQMLSLKEKEAEHGERFLYRSIETDVIAHAMERATGKKLAELISEELWQPMGAEEDANITVDSAGYGLSCGGISSTLRDFARFGILHLNNGVLKGEQIIPKHWIDDIRSGQHGLDNASLREMLPNGQYRNQFWIEDKEKTTVMCIGVFGQLIYIAPEYDMVVVKFSTWPDFIDTEHKLNTLSAIHAIAQHYQSKD
jgi:CubicO group peptidase (beta-lactamase class C family)